MKEYMTVMLIHIVRMLPPKSDSGQGSMVEFLGSCLLCEPAF